MILVSALFNVVIFTGWAVTKIEMGMGWIRTAYQIGVDSARGVTSERP
jgi:hypothetical protein